MYAEPHLSPKVLLGVHVGRGGKGVIEEDESVPLHVEGQVGTGGGGAIFIYTALCDAWKRHKDTQTAANKENYTQICVGYMCV